MQSPEGRAAVEFFDNARRLWREQVGEAVRDGERTVTLRFEVPEAIADAAVVVGRNIVQMLANGAGGVEPLPPDHVAQAVALVEHAQDEVTRYRASRSV